MNQLYSPDVVKNTIKAVLVPLKDGLCSIINIYQELINASTDSTTGQCSKYTSIRRHILKAKKSLERSEQVASSGLKSLDINIEVLIQNEGKLSQEMSATQSNLDNLKTLQTSNEKLLKESEHALEVTRGNLNSTRETLQNQEERKRNAAIVTGVGAGLLVIPVIGWIAGLAMMIGGAVDLDQASKAVQIAEEEVRNSEKEVEKYKSKVSDNKSMISQTERDIKQKQQKLEEIKKEIQTVKEQTKAVAEFQSNVRTAVNLLSNLSGSASVAEVQTRKFILLESIMKVMENVMKSAGEIGGNQLLSGEGIPTLINTLRERQTKLAAICASANSTKFLNY